MKILLSFAFIVAFCAVGFGQTIPTKTGKELKNVEVQISATEKQIREAETEKSILLVKYDETFPAVKVISAKINALRESLVLFNARKSELIKTKLIQELPNNNIELLKMIVIQNERIIELLEKRASQN